MRHSLDITSEFYRVTRNRKPAAGMLFRSVFGLVLLGGWASMTTIDESVTHVVKIVPRISNEQRIEGTLNPSASTSGKVVEVLVKESQAVVKGEMLVRLDPSEFLIRRDQEIERAKNLQKEIDAKQRQSQLSVSTHESEEAELKEKLSNEQQLVSRLTSEREIKIKRSAVELDRIAQELKRASKLRKQRAIAASEVAELRAAYLKAKEDVELAKLPIQESTVVEIKSRLKSLKSSHRESLHRIESETIGLRKQLSTANSEIQLLEMKIDQCEIVAMVDGVVSACSVRVGDWVVPGELEITVSQPGFMAESFLPSSLIGNVKEGNRAFISFDGIDRLINGSLSATVATISSDLVQEEVAMGDGSSVLVDGYRVWIKINSDEDFGNWDNLRLGMTGSVEIQTGKKQLAVYLIEKAVGNGWLPTM